MQRATRSAPTAAWCSTSRPAARPARRSCSRRRAATPPWSTSTRPSRTRSAAPWPSRSTGSCPTTPTSRRSASRSGSPGLNTAYIDGSAAYHAPEDRPEYMDLREPPAPRLERPRAGPGARRRRHLRAERPVGERRHLLPGVRGARALPRLARVAGRGPGRARGGRPRLARPCGASWSPAAGWPRASRWALAPIVLVVVVAQLFWMLLVALRPGYAELLDPWQPWWFRAALVALVVDRPAGVVRRAARPARRPRAGRRGARLAGRARPRPRVRHAGRLVPGRAAGARRRGRRHRRAAPRGHLARRGAHGRRGGRGRGARADRAAVPARPRAGDRCGSGAVRGPARARAAARARRPGPARPAVAAPGARGRCGGGRLRRRGARGRPVRRGAPPADPAHVRARRGLRGRLVGQLGDQPQRLDRPVRLGARGRARDVPAARRRRVDRARPSRRTCPRPR